MTQDYRWGDEVEIRLDSGSILGNKSIFRGVQSYEVRNNATRRLLRKEKGDVKPQDWRDDIQRHQLEGTPRIYQIGEQVDMSIWGQWVPGTIVNIFYKIQESSSSSGEIIRSYLQVHRRGQPWPQAPAVAPAQAPQAPAPQAPAPQAQAQAQQRPQAQAPAVAQAPQAQAERPAQPPIALPQSEVDRIPEFRGFKINERVEVNINGQWVPGTIAYFNAFFNIFVNVDNVGRRRFEPRDVRRIEAPAPAQRPQAQPATVFNEEPEFDEDSDEESNNEESDNESNSGEEETPQAREVFNLIENSPNKKIQDLLEELVGDNNFNSLYNLTNNKGENVLHILAKDDSNFPLIKYLFDFEFNLDINAEDNDGDTPLTYATGFNSTNIAKYLIKRGADVNKHRGIPPLYFASQFFDGYEVVKLLIENGANVNATDNDGETSLYAAAKEGQKETVKLLLDSGADPKIKAKNGKTAADVANTPEKRKMILDATPVGNATPAPVFTFPHTNVNRSNVPAEANDVINFTDENINEFIAADPKNKIFKFMDAYHAINADDFISYFLQGEKKNENTFYACKRVIGGLGVGEQDVNVNQPLFSLRNMGFTDYVLMDEFERALNSPNQYFEITREGATIAPSLSSYYSIHGPPAGSNERFDLSSRFHCQAGIQSNIYKLAILDIVESGGKASRKTKKRKTFVKKTKKGKAFVSKTKKRKTLGKLSKRKTKKRH